MIWFQSKIDILETTTETNTHLSMMIGGRKMTESGFTSPMLRVFNSNSSYKTGYKSIAWTVSTKDWIPVENMFCTYRLQTFDDIW